MRKDHDQGHVPILEATIDRDDQRLHFLVANWD